MLEKSEKFEKSRVQNCPFYVHFQKSSKSNPKPIKSGKVTQSKEFYLKSSQKSGNPKRL